MPQYAAQIHVPPGSGFPVGQDADAVHANRIPKQARVASSDELRITDLEHNLKPSLI